MVIPKYIEVKNVAGQRTALLSPKADSLKGCYPDCRLNGESTLEFMLPANSSKISYLTAECTIWAGDRAYNLLKEDASDIVRDESNKLWAKFMAVERWNELDTQFPEPYITNDPFTPSPADLAVIIVGGGGGLDLSGGRYAVGSAGHALYAVLNGSGWSIGTVDITGVYDLQMEKASRLALVKQIQNTWGGYLVWDSINKTVSLRSAYIWQNYTGFQIRYKKNLKNITKTQSNRLITKLYAFGKDDLDISSVNDGLKYVEDHSYTASVYVGIYRNPDIEEAQKLKNLALAEVAINCRPKYLYRIKTLDLRTLPDYSHEDLTVGDMADVIDSDIAPDSPRPRIIRHRYNLFMPWDCEIELGDPEERLVEKLKASFGISGYLDDTLNSSGQLSGYKLIDGSIESLKIINLTVDKLVAGTAKISTALIEDLTVGHNVTMGPDATIAWDNVTGDKPSQYTNQMALAAWAASNYATHIDAYGVYSGSFNGGMFNINPLSDSSLESGITIGGWYGHVWAGEALRIKYSPVGDGGYPGTVFSSAGGVTTVFDANVKFLNYARFWGDVDFTGATVTGLNAIAKFG